MAVSAFAAAKHVCRDSGWTLTNLDLQKILYIAHMSYMGQNNGENLIAEPFEAWDYGPVIPVLYGRIRMFGSAPVRDVFFHEPAIDDRPEGMMLSSAWLHLKGKTAGQLVSITHWENGAWARNYERNFRRKTIPGKDIIAEYNERTRLAAPRANAA